MQHSGHFRRLLDEYPDQYEMTTDAKDAIAGDAETAYRQAVAALDACEGIPESLIQSGWVRRFVFGVLRRRGGTELRRVGLHAFIDELAKEAEAAGMSWEEWT